MPLMKQPLDISFSQGLDLKSDPHRVSPGRFLSLKNSIFDKLGRLTKRNGFGSLKSLPDDSATFLTTYSQNLVAIGDSINVYSPISGIWTDKGPIQPIELSTLSLVRSNLNQSAVDSITSDTGYVCTVYTDDAAGGQQLKYVISDSVTGQNIVPPTTLPATISGSTAISSRVFLLTSYFIIIFTDYVASTPHLKYIAVSINNPTMATTAVDITSSYAPTASLSFDAVSTNGFLFIAYNTTTGGQSIKVTSLSSSLTLASAVTFTGQKATIISLCSDDSIAGNPFIYVNYYDSVSSNSSTFIVDKVLATILAPTIGTTGATQLNLTSVASGGVCKIFYELSDSYTYDTSIPTNYIRGTTITQTGTLTPPETITLSVGLASKAFTYNGVSYFLTAYDSPFQPTYFLMNEFGKIIAKLAYSNGGGYLAEGLPSAQVIGSEIRIGYLFKDLIQAVNKSTTVTGTVVSGIYTQTGINQVLFNMNTSDISVSEIGANLNISGGLLYSYDGLSVVEQGFNLYPDSVEMTTSSTGGSLTAQEYFYQATYEWTDNQGNLYRSSPSIPVSVTTTGTTSSNTINVPTLRLTYKTLNPVKIVIYRWSVAQQVYYQITSISIPLLNDTSVNFVSYVDMAADADILGNNILYTTGGVLEDIGPPATGITTLFQSRMWLVDSEDRNLLWFSKQVIEATPVEFSDLLTIYVAPTTGAQGSTGDITALSNLDTNLIVFKANAIYTINGVGPDNTGANSQFSDPNFITATVGCANQQSIVFTPSGLMFQSDKGIWLLGRDLSTNYIGAPVEAYNANIVTSAVNVPGTNQVRFTLDSGAILMYDYYVGQWCEFTGISNNRTISSTLYNSLHTSLNDLGQVFQETPGIYLDGTNAVLMSAQTGWISLAGVQGYERFYEMLLLGTYISPFKLNVQIAYDFEQNSPNQVTTVTPDNIPNVYGSGAFYGSQETYGGKSNIFKARVFPEKQKCESFQISFQEVYDPTYMTQLGGGIGEGLTLTGLELMIGVKKANRTSNAGRSFG